MVKNTSPSAMVAGEPPPSGQRASVLFVAGEPPSRPVHYEDHARSEIAAMCADVREQESLVAAAEHKVKGVRQQLDSVQPPAADDDPLHTELAAAEAKRDALAARLGSISHLWWAKI